LPAPALIAVVVLAGMLAQSQGDARWERVEVPVRETFRQVQGDDDGNVWLLGDRIHHRRTDGTWATPVTLAGEGWQNMIVARPDLIFGASPIGDEFLVSRAGVVSRLAAQPSCVSYNVAMVMRGRTVASACPYYSGIAMWRTDGSAPFLEWGIGVQDLVLIGEDDVIAVGLDGVVRVRRGMATPVYLRKDAVGPSLVWADRSNIVAASENGVFLHATWNADTGRVGEWTERKTPVPAGLNRLWGTGIDNLYAVGRAGVILHFNGKVWTAMASPVSVNLHGITGTDRNVWVAGEEGTLLCLNRR
jgi:hypothetical protein